MRAGDVGLQTTVGTNLQVKEHNTNHGAHVDSDEVSVERVYTKELVDRPKYNTTTNSVYNTVHDDSDRRASLGGIQQLNEGNTVLHKPVEKRSKSEKDDWVSANAVKFL